MKKKQALEELKNLQEKIRLRKERSKAYNEKYYKKLREERDLTRATILVSAKNHDALKEIGFVPIGIIYGRPQDFTPPYSAIVYKSNSQDNVPMVRVSEKTVQKIRDMFPKKNEQ